MAWIDLVLSDHGEQAFEIPKRTSAIHEAGHVVINSVLAVKTISTHIESRSINGRLAWGGWTEALGLEFFDTPDSPASYEALLNRARSTYAGIAAEDLFAEEHRRQGSSLDRTVHAEIATALAERGRIEGKTLREMCARVRGKKEPQRQPRS